MGLAGARRARRGDLRRDLRLCRNALGDPTLIHTTVSTNVGKPGCTPKKASGDCWHVAAGKGLPHVAIQAVAIDLLAIAREGLKRRNRLSGGMVDETGYLSELDQIAESGITPAERLLELYQTRWAGDASRVFEDFAY